MDRFWFGSLLRSEKPIQIASAFDMQESANRLRTICTNPGEPRLLNWKTRKVELCGEVSSTGGILRLRDFYPSVMSLRYYVFRFVPSASGLYLDGALRLRSVVAIPICVYLAFCALEELRTIARIFYDLFRPGSVTFHPYGRLMELMGPILSFAMIWSWYQVGIWLNRKREPRLITIISTALSQSAPSPKTS